MRKVFITHSTRDKKLADQLVDLINTGIGVPHNEIFCTSLEGLGIPQGTSDFKEYIRKELDGCEAVIALISANYYASPFCMCELGALWVLAKTFFPILVPPTDFDDLRGVLSGTQCCKLTDDATPSMLYTRLSKLTLNPVPIERWDVKKRSYLRKLPQVIASLPKPESVKADEHARALTALQLQKELAIHLQEEIDNLHEQVEEIAKAKGAKEVTEIRRRFSSELDQFEALKSHCRTALAKLPRIVREAVFYNTRGEAFAPDFDEFGGELRKAVENMELTEDRNEQHSYWPSADRPKIATAIQEIATLEEFLTHASYEFYEQVTEQLGDAPDIKRRSFWDDQLW